MQIRSLFKCIKGMRRDCMAIGAAAALLVAIAVHQCTKSPLDIVILLEHRISLPPIWLLNILWYVWFALLGATCGIVMSCEKYYCQTEKYKGGMLFVIMLTLEYLWYPLFFGGAKFFISLLVLLICSIFCFLSALCFYRVYRTAGIVVFVHCLWLGFVSWINIMAFFAM